MNIIPLINEITNSFNESFKVNCYSSDRTWQKLGRTIKFYLFLCQNCFITKNLF